MKRPNFYITTSLVVTSVVAAAIIIGIFHSRAKASPATKPTPPAVVSQFSFGGATGWHKGPANRTSLALFSDDTTCFTSIEHKTGTVDVTAKLQKQRTDLAASGATMAAGATPLVALQTGAAKQQYVLHQYSLSGGSQQIMGGLELGYVQLSNSYLEIQGHCNTAGQLPTTIAALQAYRFDDAN
jgi:hypothetical protein